jgi:hypothetical protein
MWTLFGDRERGEKRGGEEVSGEREWVVRKVYSSGSAPRRFCCIVAKKPLNDRRSVVTIAIPVVVIIIETSSVLITSELCVDVV